MSFAISAKKRTLSKKKCCLFFRFRRTKKSLWYGIRFTTHVTVIVVALALAVAVVSEAAAKPAKTIKAGILDPFISMHSHALGPPGCSLMQIGCTSLGGAVRAYKTGPANAGTRRRVKMQKIRESWKILDVHSG